MAEGTVTRLAALTVLEELRPAKKPPPPKSASTAPWPPLRSTAW
jgi:hypothetical protein